MLPKNIDELNAIRVECFAMVRKRALFSAAAATVPAFGVDIASDVGILLKLIPAINRRFGLAPDQVAGYSPAVKQVIFQVIKRAGFALVGAEVTRSVLMHALKHVTGRAVTRQALKFVPVLGWGANAAIGFCAMKYVGNSHVKDCYAVCAQALESQRERVSRKPASINLNQAHHSSRNNNRVC